MIAPTTEERAKSRQILEEQERILGECTCYKSECVCGKYSRCVLCQCGDAVLELIKERDRWKEKSVSLGDPVEWFPGLLENDLPGHATTKARAELLVGFCKIFGFNKEQQEAVEQFASGIFEGVDELQLQARALLEKAKK